MGDNKHILSVPFCTSAAFFRNFSAIFLTSRFSDCLPTLVQNNETPCCTKRFKTGGAIRTLTPFFFYYGIHSLMFPGCQILT